MTGRTRSLNISVSSLAIAFIVLTSTALLSWFTALGAPARLEWRARIAQARADHYLTITLDRDYRGYHPPLLSADQLRRLAGAPGVDDVVWATGTINDPFAAPAPFRLASLGYPRYKRMRPLYASGLGGGLSFKSDEVWISRLLAERLLGSAKEAVGKSLLLGDSERTISAVYEGAGPILAAAVPEDLEKGPTGRPLEVGEVYVKTKEPAARALGQLRRWIGQHGVLPAGLTLETMSSVLRPDRATLRDPHLRALRWVGTGALYAMLGIVVFALGIGVSIQLREREKQRTLRYVWGATPTGVVLEEATSQTTRIAALVFLGACLGTLAALPSGGALDSFGLLVLLATFLVLTLASLLPVVLSARPRNAYYALLRSRVGLRARSVAWLAKLAVLVSAAALMFSLSVVRRAETDLSNEIRALGAGIYMLYPDYESGRGKPMSLLGAGDLAWLRKRWPELRVALLNNFIGSALHTPDGAWTPVNVRVSLGDYWGVTAQKPVVGDASGVVVTSDLRGLVDRGVKLRLGPSSDNIIECEISGAVEPIQARSVESPRLKTGWVWLAADGKCWSRAFVTPVAAIRVPPDAGDPQAMSEKVAGALSKRHPGGMPFRVKPVVANAQAKINRLGKLLLQIAAQQVGLGILSLLGIALVGVLLARAWVLVYALHRALGAPRAHLLAQGMVWGLGLVFVPAAVGALVGAIAFHYWSRSGTLGGWYGVEPYIYPALAMCAGSAALGLLAGGLAAWVALKAPPAQRLMQEGA